MIKKIRYSSFHGRDRELKVGPDTNSKRIQDSIVLLRTGQLVKVINDDLHAHPIKVSPFRPRMDYNLPWEAVGVYKFDGLDTETVVQINREDVIAKGLVSGNLLTLYMKPWFMSKKDF